MPQWQNLAIIICHGADLEAEKEVIPMQQQCILSFDKRFPLNSKADTLPFHCELSLAPLVAFWQQGVRQDHAIEGALATEVQAALHKAPELLEPIADMAIIDVHRELVDVLMTLAFPRAFWAENYTAALLPFQMQSFYATPSFERLLMDADGYLCGWVNVDTQTVEHLRLLHAYSFILFQVYGISLDFEYPLILTATDPDSGLERHFRMNFDGRFIQVKTIGDVPPLTDAMRKHLLAHLADPQVLMDLLPPERFIFQGFAVLNTVEVTDQEVLSSLKRDLIEKESIISNARFYGMQQKLRTLFRKPDLCFGLAAIQGERVFMLTSGTQIEYG
jgi:hypothetical protein